MVSVMTRQRLGITLIETLVVLAILGILLAMLVPAVQHARESARRSTCQNNLRQMAVAVQNHELAHTSIPSLYYGSFLKQPRHALDEFRFHSWRTAMLPQLEQNGLYGKIDLFLPATDISNQPNLNTAVAVFVCPSTSVQNKIVPEIFDVNLLTNVIRKVGTAARSDYEAIAGVSFPMNPPVGSADLRGIKFGAWGEPTYDTRTNLSISYRSARLGDITDGLSNTILIGERAGRPDWYRRGKPTDPYPYANPQEGMNPQQAAWGISTHIWWLVFHHNQNINEDNAHSLYSFHTTGANVALADCSVRFLSDSIDQDTLNALATRSAGDVVTLD